MGRCWLVGAGLAGIWAACGNFPAERWRRGRLRRVALARELEEELGVSVEVGEKLDAVVEWTDGEVSIRLTGYWCRVSDGQPVALEHEELRWCEVSELKGLEWAEADVPLVEEILNSKL